MSQNLTDWFPSHINPVRVGVYERDYGQREKPSDPPQYQYWDGKNWHYGTQKVSAVYAKYANGRDTQFDVCSSYYKHDWRGLSSPSES